eukprot:COSAG01_NODE_53586_length_338_cov_0.648536_2_plen_37_part_01
MDKMPIHQKEMDCDCMPLLIATSTDLSAGTPALVRIS